MNVQGWYLFPQYNRVTQQKEMVRGIVIQSNHEPHEYSFVTLYDDEERKQKNSYGMMTYMGKYNELAPCEPTTEEIQRWMLVRMRV